MNAVVIAIAVMFILSLARVSVVLTLVISAIIGGLVAGLSLSDTVSAFNAGLGDGAEVALAGNVYDEAYQRAVQIQKESKQTFIHAFNDYDVIAGQGTIGLEILEDLPDVAAVVVPIGGGGLIAGLAALKRLLLMSKYMESRLQAHRLCICLNKPMQLKQLLMR